jgi:hypothetical protein
MTRQVVIVFQGVEKYARVHEEVFSVTADGDIMSRKPPQLSDEKIVFPPGIEIRTSS